jgi:NADPH:quinone reductase-like Zn-dependent oxidoreductase
LCGPDFFKNGARESTGITVSSIYVRADGNQLRKLAQQLGDGQLEIPIAASYRLADAAQALAQAPLC